jgi:hypothetical protein
VAAFYLFILAARPGENVQLIPGHDVPDRFAVMLGATGVPDKWKDAVFDRV